MSLSKNFVRLVSVFCLMLALIGLLPARAYANAAITPTMLLIEGRTRYADLNVINTGKDMNSYDMGWQFLRMKEDTGAYVNSDVSMTDFDLAKHLVFTPRRVTLGASSAQKIRIALRLNGETPPPGDYRAHFFIHELPRNPVNEEEPVPADRTTLGVNINFGFTIPVIYRVGTPNDTATIGTIHVSRNEKAGNITVKVPVTKSKSAYGLFGEIAVYHVQGGLADRVGGVSNANIFPEITKRTFDVILNQKSLDPGTLRVVLTERDKEDHIYDQKNVPIK